MKKPATKKSDGLAVFVSYLPTRCIECDTVLPTKTWVTLQQDPKGSVCLSCSDLDHLVYLPSGDTALTRRSKKYSKLSAVVLEYSRRRRRNERQGLLVESAALAKAEEECDADAGQREERRKQAAGRRAELDEVYIRQFSQRIRELYPSCPEGRENEIAEHACRKYSGRVGRSAEAKELNANTVRLAVQAHIRHQETDYDEQLLMGTPRLVAREHIGPLVKAVLAKWARRS